MSKKKDNLLLEENKKISFMSNDELKQFWFYMSKEEMYTATKARIYEFKEIGWIDPFA